MVGGKVLLLDLKLLELIPCKFTFLVSSNVLQYLRLLYFSYTYGSSLGGSD